MSCYCRQSISVSVAQLRRGQSAEAELRRLAERILTELRRVSAENQARSEREWSALAERGRRAEQAVAGLSEGLRRQELDVARRLAAMDSDVRGRIAGLDTIGSRLRDDIRQVGRRLTGELAEARRVREAAVAESRASLGALAGRSRDAADAAATVLADCRGLVELIDNSLPHARLAPGELAALTRRLASAEESAAAGRSQAALAAATGIAGALADLRLSVELADREWRAVRSAASGSLRSLQAMVDGSPRVPGTAPGVDVDVDHWSGGALAELAAELAATRAKVDGDIDTAGSDAGRLYEIIDRALPGYQTRLAEILAAATDAQSASQLRINVADMAAEALAAQGFSLVGGVYVGGDERDAFHAKVAHEDGTEVVVVVEADPVAPSACVLRLESYDTSDAPGAEEIRRLRGTELAAALADAGFAVGVPSRDSGSPDPALRDLERTARQSRVGARATR